MNMVKAWIGRIMDGCIMTWQPKTSATWHHSMRNRHDKWWQLPDMSFSFFLLAWPDRLALEWYSSLGYYHLCASWVDFPFDTLYTAFCSLQFETTISEHKMYSYLAPYTKALVSFSMFSNLVLQKKDSPTAWQTGSQCPADCKWFPDPQSFPAILLPV